jgi:hypothetical protein
MAKDLKKILSESAGLTEEQQIQISEAWNSKLSEAREEISANLREEFARKYTHDKGVLAEAMDRFLTDKIRVELEEFAQDKRDLITERAAYRRKIKEHTSVLDKFITQQVAKEVKELHEDKQKLGSDFKKLENFILKQLAEEIREFRKDKRELVEQKVKMVREGKAHLNETKKAFISRAAKLVEQKINDVLRSEMSQFKGDIKVARENEFGRRMYEAFVGEYMTSYLNEGTEVRKLQKVVESKDREIEAIKESVQQKAKIAESLQSELNVARDRINRNKVMSELLSPLAKEKRAVMKGLLESVQTKELERSFNKYLPAVLNETSVPRTNAAKRPLTEGSKLSERTGNRVNNAQQGNSDSEFNSELSHIKTLAGLK